MKTFQIRSLASAVAFVGLALSGAAQAIPLPDTASTCAVGPNGTCFKITNGASNGTAIWGNATSTGTGYGVFGTGNEGVRGLASTATGTGVAGFGGSNAGAKGVYGTSSNGSGVWGEATAAGTGVVGKSASGTGVAGSSTGTGIAVYGDNTNASGWAGFFNGRAFTTAGVWSGSDARLKKDIQDSPYGLNALQHLRPVTYKWKKEAPDPGTQIGLIAQEVQKVIPEVVSSDATSGMLSINYPALLPVMIKAVQEQQKTVQEQQKTIEQQNVRINSLERQRPPMRSSLFPGDLSEGLALGWVPLGLVVAALRRRKVQ